MTDRRIRDALLALDTLEQAALSYTASQAVPLESVKAGLKMCADSVRSLVATLTPAPSPAPLEIAERIARQAHEGQKDTVTGEPYITHVERVVSMVEGEQAKIVAWLHDVVEDSSVTLDNLKAQGFDAEIIRAVALLTRLDHMTYGDYIQCIKAGSSELARTVKIADLRDHLHPDCPERLRPRYEKALAVLAPVAHETPMPSPVDRLDTRHDKVHEDVGPPRVVGRLAHQPPTPPPSTCPVCKKPMDSCSVCDIPAELREWVEILAATCALNGIETGGFDEFRRRRHERMAATPAPVGADTPAKEETST